MPGTEHLLGSHTDSTLLDLSGSKEQRILKSSGGLSEFLLQIYSDVGQGCRQQPPQARL